MNKYNKTLKKNKIFQGISRKATFFDNSPMKNSFGVMKRECIIKKYKQLFESFFVIIKRIMRWLRNLDMKVLLS
ncbi:hypothetical protein BGU60_08610 [Clostridioides difficile]|uniref:hypothetical protein n=1 Tax=Clostridioides difficile TaxID=1496 RepID=UPI000BB1C7BE|nr:hypothetical protein [Clostridioides difficile]PBI19899.1 hypothetical protein BGU60_08610 [Clostridioides difficile]